MDYKPDVLSIIILSKKVSSSLNESAEIGVIVR